MFAHITAATTRDEVVFAACEGAAEAGHVAIFLALRHGTLKGWEAAGPGVSAKAVRNLWIPASSPSIFRGVLSNATPYLGPHGPTAADTIFKAAAGSRGGEVMLQPVVLSGKTVGVLCVDGLKSGAAHRKTIEKLAVAIADAFKRIIMAGKSDK